MKKKKVSFDNNIQIRYIPNDSYGEYKSIPNKVDINIFYYGILISSLFTFIFLIILLK